MWSWTATINITLLCWLAVYLPTDSTCHLLNHCLLIKLWGIRVTEVISIGPVLLVNLVKMLNKLVCQNLIAHVNTYGCHLLQSNHYYLISNDGKNLLKITLKGKHCLSCKSRQLGACSRLEGYLYKWIQREKIKTIVYILAKISW